VAHSYYYYLLHQGEEDLAIYHMNQSLHHGLYYQQLAFAYMGQFEMTWVTSGGGGGEEVEDLVTNAAEHLDTAISM